MWAFGLVSCRCAWGGLLLAGFRVGSTGFSWFRPVSGRFGWFRIVPLFSNYDVIGPMGMAAMPMVYASTFMHTFNICK